MLGTSVRLRLFHTKWPTAIPKGKLSSSKRKSILQVVVASAAAAGAGAESAAEVLVVVAVESNSQCAGDHRNRA